MTDNTPMFKIKNYSSERLYKLLDDCADEMTKCIGFGRSRERAELLKEMQIYRVELKRRGLDPEA